MDIRATRVKGFKTVYVQRKGQTVARDMVEITRVGDADRHVVPKFIDEISRLRPIADPVNDIAAVQAHMLWDYIRPQYEAWKNNQAAPVNGIPLAAWPGVTPELAELLKANGYKSVEEVAQANDAAIARVQVPGMRALVDQAKAFLAAQDRNKVAVELAEKDRQINELNSSVADLTAMVQQLIADKPRRGRPPKADEAEVA